MSNIAILGAGLAGLSTAYHLGKGYRLFEREKEVGGVCRSFLCHGYTFDTTGHVLHFRNPEVASFVEDLLEGEWYRSQRSAWVYTKEKYVPYPFQAHFTNLSDPIRQECLSGFLAAQQKNRVGEKLESGATFEQWILSHFGRGIAKHFLIPYNTKLWGMAPSELGVDGVQQYIPIPTLQEILSGTDRPFGYNASFYYPSRGGIHQVALALRRRLTEPLFLEHEVEQIDLTRKKIYFTHGAEFPYTRIFSTIPLPELGQRITPLPPSIQQLFHRLKWVSLYSLHLGVSQMQESDKHWIYFADEEFPFYRVVMPSNYGSHLAPRGKGTVQVEVSHAMGRPALDLTQLRNAVIDGLRKVGLLEDESQIEVEQAHCVRYGYAVFTKECQQMIKTITEFLADHAIDLVGRYSSWEYMSLEDCLLAGKEAAQ